MTRTGVMLLVAVAVVGCGDPETEDRRGYTKAPLENPGLLIDGEEATVVAAMSRTDRPRPPLELGVDEGDGADDGAGAEGQEVALAAGVTQAQFDQGRQLFTGQGGCQACHGPDAAGTQLGPDLTDAEWLHVSEPTVDAVAEVIRTGVPQPAEHPAPMPPMGGATLTPEQVQALAGYVASLGATP